MGDYSRHGYIWVPSRRDLLKTAGVLAAGLVAPRIARAATFGVVAHMAQGLLANGGDTSSNKINTTGASLLVLALSWYSGSPTITDRTDSGPTGNTWTLLASDITSMPLSLYYVINPVVGPGHYVTVVQTSGYPGVGFMAFSGADLTAPYDGQHSQHGDGLSWPGSITPAENNALVIGAVANQTTTARVITNGSMTMLDSTLNVTGASVGISTAYVIQTTATAINPTWTSLYANGDILASFKPAAGGGTRRRVVVTTGGE